MPEGTVITRNMLSSAEINASEAPKKSAASFESVVGLVASEPLYAGEFLWTDRLVTEEEYRKTAASEIKGLGEGLCIVTVELSSASSGVASVLRAGNTVDVYECREAENEEGEKETVTERVISDLFIRNVLNKELRSLSELDEVKEKTVEETSLDFKPVYVVFLCTDDEAATLIRLEREKTMHLTLTAREG
ncbi:MAG: SAF domain-containing protein [Oscillospiraceae bacterium]|nr:SAF domain-containing protein [Oscillospiraceae bacterium]